MPDEKLLSGYKKACRDACQYCSDNMRGGRKSNNDTHGLGQFICTAPSREEYEESLESELEKLAAAEQERDAAKIEAQHNRERLDWIACAFLIDIDDMLTNSVCDDVDDLCRFIDAKIRGAKEEDRTRDA